MLVNFSAQNKKPLSFSNNSPVIQIIDPQAINSQMVNPQLLNPQYVGQPIYNQLPAGRPAQKVYENPVSMTWEYFSASIKPIVFSAIAGLGVALLFPKEGKINTKAGAVVGGICAVVTTAIALYNRKVSGSVKKREMDVFSRMNKAEVNLTEKIDDRAGDNNYPLSDAIDLYTRFNIGRQGGGMMLLNR